MTCDWTAANIRDFRRSMRLTQEQLGRKCGVGRVAVVLWETGKGRPSNSSLLTLDYLAVQHNWRPSNGEGDERIPHSSVGG